jgi:hypothetical protein
MAVILRILLHSRNKQQNEANQIINKRRNYPFTPLKEDPNNKEIPVKSNKKSKPP